MAPFQFNARSLRAFFNGKFLLAVVGLATVRQTMDTRVV
jgi:hypothetical protein